jgi:hypothetical protein
MERGCFKVFPCLFSLFQCGLSRVSCVKHGMGVLVELFPCPFHERLPRIFVESI